VEVPVYLRFLILSVVPMIATAQTPDTEGVYRVGNGVTPPRIVSRKEPEYSEEARRAKVNAIVRLNVVIGEDGDPASVSVTRGAGFGLDEQAIRAIQTNWHFEPGKKDGVPVKVRATVEVNLRLLNKDYADQLDRLTFTGPSRPELINGAMPINPVGLRAHIRVGLTVTPQGEPINFRVLESTDDNWSAEVLQAMRSWRFRGPQSDVDGVLEITVGAYKPNTLKWEPVTIHAETTLEAAAIALRRMTEQGFVESEYADSILGRVDHDNDSQGLPEAHAGMDQ
jgi:TonB family protein